ncbi:hypothetical protein K450DRAFT_231515 [Umbelopsis ramanniana AG]|uniref:Uncharacterized protein n=1 Tax=Umbelopsis ramanniana AG TaxID=1314678 RepID=A0AAD5EDT8_UMBRA|nr:uncharacterized protein K450DRAFT_231515 [Umbelopsis ramanniana AG]KAI8581487.1 hypothetical protein K450DRAFT_231515 [Umbelopsis ramanniana AG]
MSSPKDITAIVTAAVKAALEAKKSSRFKTKLPEPYNGERKTAVLDNWLFAIERYQDAEDLNESDTIKLAVTLLTKEAATWW